MVRADLELGLGLMFDPRTVPCSGKPTSQF